MSASPATRTTGYVWHEQYAWHDTGTRAGFPSPGGCVQPYMTFESPESKARFAGLVEVSGLLGELHRITAAPATAEQVLRVHTAEHVERLQTLSAAGGGDAGDGFTPFGPGGWDIARLAAGGTIAATSAVLEGTVDNAYALVRPPGHHATRDSGVGFCLLANVPIAIEEARRTHGVERVLIVDYDVHHGNGAQGIYWDDPNVVTLSIHQRQLFPTVGGELEETGGPGAEGSCINVPLPAGCGNGAYTSTIERVVGTAARNLRPDIIMVSSGFDPGALDPLGCMSVTSGGFGAMAELLVGIAEETCGGRLVFSHEGGYSAVQVPFCGVAVLEALSGSKTDVADPFGPSFDDSPAHTLEPWQDTVIVAAEALADQLSGRW